MSEQLERLERDSLGEVRVPEQAYWGAQTQRSRYYFEIGEETMPMAVIHALALIKKASAQVNHRLGLLDETVMKLIDTVSDEVLQGRWADEFPLKIWQTGSGTQTNMNVNEVIANRAIALAGGVLGSKHPVHPNDHVNCSQSSNDVFPTAMHIATVLAVHRHLKPALDQIQARLKKKMQEFQGIIKVGRTHCQDAVPLTVDQEFSAFLAQLQALSKQVDQALEPLYALALGGTAVGTGLNTDPAFAKQAVGLLADLTGLPFRPAPNLFAALACHDPLVHFSGVLRTLACALMKMANDIRFLGSGPRCGLGELILPENEPGSSIMPGKVNPTQSEALTMICVQVMGNDATIALAGSQGHFQLNVFKPVLIYNLLQSIRLLSDGMHAFSDHCLLGLQVNHAQLKTNLEHSLMLVTALNPLIGYDKAAQIARKAYQNKISLRQAAVESGFLTEAEFEKAVQPAKMLGPQ